MGITKKKKKSSMSGCITVIMGVRAMSLNIMKIIRNAKAYRLKIGFIFILHYIVYVCLFLCVFVCFTWSMYHDGS